MSSALYDDQVTRDLLDAMLSATQPAGVGQSQSSVNLGESLGSGTYIDTVFAGGDGGGPGGDGSAPSTGSVSEGLSGMSAFGQGMSALGMIGQDPVMAQFGNVMGQATAVAAAANQAMSGNLGQAAFSLAPMVASFLGVNPVAASVAANAVNPSVSPAQSVTTAAKGMLGVVSPIALLTLTLAEKMGIVSPTNAVATAMANNVAEQQNIDPLDALMTVTNAFNTVPANSLSFAPVPTAEEIAELDMGAAMAANSAQAAAEAQAQAEEGAAIAAGFGFGDTAAADAASAAVAADAMGAADAASADSAAADAASAAAAADAMGDADSGATGDASGGGGGGGGKIICTAMNQAYGFGAFRQIIWLQYAEKRLTKAHEVGYHTLFLPFVAAGYKHNKWYSSTIRKILEHDTRHRTADLRAEMRGTKRNNLGRFYRTIFEPLCWVVGKLKGY
jgi:hypothetical protein